MSYQRMSRDEWADAVKRHGPENALALVKNFGTVLEDTGLPPTLADASGPTAMPQNAQMPTGALPGNAPQDEEGALRAEMLAYPGKQAADRKRQFEAAQAAIAQQYRAPTASDTLFALSQALLAPKPYRGFAGTIYNVNQALGSMNRQSSEAEQKRNAAQFELQQSYDQGVAADQLKSMEMRLRLLDMAKDEQAAKNKTRTGFNPITGELVNMDTGAPIEDTSAPVLSPEQVAELAKDPRNRGFKFRTTDGRQMEIK